VIWLRENFRFDQSAAIGELLDLVNRGQAQAVIERLRQGTFKHIEWLEDGTAELSQATKQSLLEPYIDYVNQLSVNHHDLLSLFYHLGRYKILCAQRDGSRGVAGINQLVSDMIRGRNHGTHLRRDHGSAPQKGPGGWYAGHCVMVLRNDYVLGRFNGDIGIVIPDTQQQALVYFPDQLKLENAIALSRLPEHEPAFALTVHKAQGSEFDRVGIVLPSQASSVVNKALLYTAISRAKASVSIVASEAVLRQTITTPVKRHSGIRSRIARQRTNP
jgi:exodeoxyribonuclease V alpha subunit